MTRIRMNLRFEGGEEIAARLREIPADLGGPILRNAAVTALEPVVETARARVPIREGELQRSLGVRVVASNPSFVDVRSEADPHAHLVEFGTTTRRQKSGKGVGQMPASPFMRPAWDELGGRVMQERFRKELTAALGRSFPGASR